MAKVEMRAQDVLERFYGSNGIVLPVDVVGIANENGINVNRARFSGAVSDLVYGFIEKDGTGVSITVNACNSLTRRRFTIAHELGHFFCIMMVKNWSTLIFGLLKISGRTRGQPICGRIVDARN